jgi:rare lipoprotein A
MRIVLGLLLIVLVGCAGAPPPRPSAPPGRPASGPDGPPQAVPPGLWHTPDAQPRVEPLRVGGPNKPYDVQGQRYVPLTGDVAFAESGGASWYGRKFHGQPTSSGEVYDMFAMTAAHKTLPIPSYARVRNPANGRVVVVRINDRGPFVAGRVIDLSYTAALKLGVLTGVAPVQVQRLTFEEIRAGKLLEDAQ